MNFDNTKVAFQSKSDTQIRKAYFLFKLISYPIAVRMGKWLTKLAFAIYIPISNIIKKTLFEQFCGGETINECRNSIERLKNNDVGTILDYSIEGKEEDADLNESALEIIRTIEFAHGDPAIPFSVFKPTGISKSIVLEKANSSYENLTEDEKIDYSKTKNRFDQICKKSYELNVPIFVDAEDSWIQKTIDTICEEMMWKYNTNKALVFTTIQLYRIDRFNYLKSLHQRAKKDGIKIGVKLVRGAYMEKERERAIELDYPDPIQPSKEATDKDYNLALAYCIQNIKDINICVGSHNEISAQIAIDLMKLNNLEKNDPRVYFAQLYGMSDHISFNLADKGYNVAKYLPYGPVKEVVPYLIRRAEENTSIAGQTSRELSLLTKERKRRRGL